MTTVTSVSIANKNDQDIVGDLYTYQDSDKLVIMCLGYSDTKSNEVINSFTKMLNIKGLNVYSFDFSKDTKVFDIEKQVGEIVCVIDYFSGQFREIVLVGVSLGALNATIVANISKKVTKLVTVNGFFGFPLLGQEMLKIYLLTFLSAIFSPVYRRVLKFFWQRLQFKKISIPVLVIHSKDDKVVSHIQSKIFYSKVRHSDKMLNQITGVDHGLSVEGSIDKVTGIIADWILVK